MIYFDNAATTYPKPQCVYDAVNEGMQKFSFNSGRGSYSAASETFAMIQNTREKLAKIANTNPQNIVFTSSATESLNIIINGLDIKRGDIIYISPFEHNSIVRTLHNCGAIIKIIPFSKYDWSLIEDKYNDMLAIDKPKAVIISHISNVTGYELPYENIFTKAKKYNIITVLDSAQGFGTYKVNTKNVDYLVFAGHKSLYSVFGVAGIAVLSNNKLKIFKAGGTGSDSLNPDMPDEMPNRLEAGSLNSVAIYALNKSIDFILDSGFSNIKHELTSYLISKLKEFDDVIIYCPSTLTTNGIVSFNIKGFTADDVGKILASQYDICVRTGYHCAPYIHDFIDDKKFAGCVRVSFSGFNTKEEIDVLVLAIKNIVGGV